MAHSDKEQHLAERVLESIKRDAGLRAYEINVTARGGAVHLGGIVDVLVEKMRAEEIVAGVDGVAAVQNDLAVCTDGEITDDDVDFEVAEEFQLDPGVDTSRVYAESKQGVVHLHGRVDTADDSEAAIKAAARARGVKDVVSHLEVSGGKGADDATITNGVTGLDTQVTLDTRQRKTSPGSPSAPP
ncbi:MAG: BON domain-containing protein [Bacillota bacterium]|nr:BON domain-containing protein [Bacillota bacterium]